MTISKYTYGDNVSANPMNNVVDEYKGMNAVEVRELLKDKRKDFISIFQNVGHDLNIATAIRSNNAFCGKEVYIVGRKRFDARGMCGVKHYEELYHADSFLEVFTKLKGEGYTVIAVDNISSYNPKNVFDYIFSQKTAFVFGNESDGLDKDTIDMCDDMVYIPTSGSVRSLNVSTAASIVMSMYCFQHR